MSAPDSPTSSQDAFLLEMLTDAQQLGFLGPAPVHGHLAHSVGFVEAWSALRSEPPAQVLDLGSGGGIPGLPLAFAWPTASLTLLDAAQRRTEFLKQVIERAGLAARVSVVAERAESAGRGTLRGQFDLVVARSFGSPAVTAECAAPFLRVDGLLVVSEPPVGSENRWPSESLGMVGLRPEGLFSFSGSFQVLSQSELCPPRYPRRVGVPGKRPLF